MQAIRIFVLILLTIPAVAQIEPRPFEFGPKVGANLSNFRHTDSFEYSQKMTLGLLGGIFTRFNHGKFSLQPEFIYQAKGANLSKPVSGKHTYRYFSVPVVVAYTPIKHVYFEAGYEHGWAINRLDGLPSGTKPFGPNKGQDQNVIIGARVNLLDMFSLFSINLRYVHGLNNVTEMTSNNQPLDFKNRVFQVSASYTFSEQYLWNKKFGVKKKKN